MSQTSEFGAVLQGRPLDTEHYIIGALVRRLGGTVTLTPEELLAVQGVALWEVNGLMRIDAGNWQETAAPSTHYGNEDGLEQASPPGD